MTEHPQLPPAPAPKISMRGVRKAFGENVVLDGIDLDVANGEVITLIGASGSGKSTLLRCTNLLEPIDDGVMLLDGIDVAEPGLDPDPIRRRIGMIFQSFNLFPHMSVVDNVAIGPRKVLGVPKPRRGSGAATSWSDSGSSRGSTPTPISSPAANNSGWRSHARSRWIRK